MGKSGVRIRAVPQDKDEDSTDLVSASLHGQVWSQYQCSTMGQHDEDNTNLVKASLHGQDWSQYQGSTTGQG